MQGLILTHKAPHFQIYSPSRLGSDLTCFIRTTFAALSGLELTTITGYSGMQFTIY